MRPQIMQHIGAMCGTYLWSRYVLMCCLTCLMLSQVRYRLHTLSDYEHQILQIIYD